MSTFVSVGNTHQQFQRLLLAVDAIAPELPQPVFVQNGHTDFSPLHCQAADFVPMEEFEQRVRDSALVIVQAGGGGIMLALRHGRTPVIVPRLSVLGEHIDDHQLVWGRALASTERVVLCEDVAHLSNAVALALKRQQQLQAQPFEPPLVKLVSEALRRRGDPRRTAGPVGSH